MRAPLVLALDGGNTKSVAVLASLDGEVIASAVGGCGDIYGAESEGAALAVLSGTASQALRSAGAKADQVAVTVASLAGADWPEDFVLYKAELQRQVGLSGQLHVVNDGLGPLRLGNRSGTGVAIVVGTGAAVGARGPTGEIWHASFWLPLSAAGSLGRRGLEAVYRAALGLGPETSLTGRVLELYRATDVEALLHAFTRRQSPLSALVTKDASRLVLDEDAADDPVACAIVDSYAEELSGYAAMAGKKVHLNGPFPLVLVGGLLGHATSRLPAALAFHVRNRDARAEPVFPEVAPVAGALLDALEIALGPPGEQVRSRALASVLLRPGTP